MKTSIFIAVLLTILISCNEPVEFKSYSIKGYIGLDQNVQDIEPITIKLYQNDILIATSVASEFEFNALKGGEDYTLVPESNEPSKNGMSTLDLILLDNFITGVGHYTPFEFIAADMNKDGVLDASDKDLLSSCILSSAGCSGHRFVTLDYSLEGAGHADQITFDNLSSNQEVQFFGIKIGDISSQTH